MCETLIFVSVYFRRKVNLKTLSWTHEKLPTKKKDHKKFIFHLVDGRRMSEKKIVFFVLKENLKNFHAFCNDFKPHKPRVYSPIVVDLNSTRRHRKSN